MIPAGKIEAQLKAEVAELMAKAEAADQADIADGRSIPDELARREDRLRKLGEARAQIEARAKERFVREQAEHEAKLAARKAKAAVTGKKPSGRVPKPPVETPLAADQINLTDDESRIMPVAGGGFDCCSKPRAAIRCVPRRNRAVGRPWTQPTSTRRRSLPRRAVCALDHRFTPILPARCHLRVGDAGHVRVVRLTQCLLHLVAEPEIVAHLATHQFR